MKPTRNTVVYTVVEVWRGIATGARVFENHSAALSCAAKLRRGCNLEEDDVQVFRNRIHTTRANTKR